MVTQHRLLEPFEASQVQTGVVSFGVSSYGYDLRLGERFMVPPIPEVGAIMDPKNPSQPYSEVQASSYVIPPQSKVLGCSLEYFRLPRQVTGLLFNKSTYARLGLIVNGAPLEAEWEGYLTLALINPMPYAIRVHSGEGIAQVIFLVSDEECEQSYRDKKGKYQSAQAIQTATVKTEGL